MQADHAASAWRAGKSATEIARGFKGKFGFNRTRNSIIGKLNAMGLMKTRAMRRRFLISDFISNARDRYGKFGKPQPLPPDEPIPLTAVNLEDRQPWQCCWPVNHGNPYLFCGDRIEKGHVAFCGYHAMRSKRLSERK